MTESEDELESNKISFNTQKEPEEEDSEVRYYFDLISLNLQNLSMSSVAAKLWQNDQFSV